MKRRKTSLAILVALALAAAFGWRYFSAVETVAPPVLAQVVRGDVAETVLASGMIEAAQLVSVGARVSGQVETLAVRLGQSVQAGDLIAQIDSQDQQNTVLQAEAALANIEAQISAKRATLQRAEAALERQTRLGGLSTQDTLESATAEVLVTRAELDALEAQKASAEVTVGTARLALERTSITAPISGTVVAVVVKQGQTVNAAQAAPTIVKIADLSTMLVKTEISEADVMNVARGQNVIFTTLGAPDLPFRAVVREIEPAPTGIETSDTISSDSAVYYNGLLEVENLDGRLRIGMTAEVSVELARAENVLTVPASAIRRDAEGSYVEVFDPAEGTTRRRAVTVGLNDKITAEIVEGLAEGERVVTGTAAATAATTGNSQGGMGPPPMF
ncbi:efflux RND transporter periplasmic adaptor subunit [Pseudogemmobacter sonorensis]|uniref:efflux RND transporter periplasmic adaptor subunit n=1 Tax=Pseudogemmobacter sonorensis TaxID=2989681 RepID=UPI0036B1A6B8